MDQIQKPILYAAVLAGGQSSRMGRDKKFLQIDGELLVDRIVRLLSQAIGEASDRVFLCGDVPGRKCLLDFFSGIGPLGGIHSAVRQVMACSPQLNSWLLVSPVDMPLLTLEVLKRLILAIPEAQEKKVDFISYTDFEMPFLMHCDSYSESVLDFICMQKLSSLRSIRRLQDVLGHHGLSFQDHSSNAMLNVNTPSDWSKLHSGGLI